MSSASAHKPAERALFWVLLVIVVLAALGLSLSGAALDLTQAIAS